MAIYTGGMRMKDEARAAAKRIAAQQAQAEAGETKRKGRAGIFGRLAGMGMAELGKKFLLPTLLTTLSGGSVNPLTLKLLQAAITGGSAWLGRAGAHQATTGKWDKALGGMSLKTSGQVDKIEAGGKYGYGREEAKTLSQALTEQTKSKEDWGTLAGDIGGSLASQITGEKISDLLGEGGRYNPFKDSEELSALEQFVTTKAPIPEFAGEDWSPIKAKELDIPSFLSDYDDTAVSEELFAQGGQVPKYYGGGSVSGSPTIAGYFGEQGKTLGGSNTQSLSQILGR